MKPGIILFLSTAMLLASCGDSSSSSVSSNVSSSENATSALSSSALTQETNVSSVSSAKETVSEESFELPASSEKETSLEEASSEAILIDPATLMSELEREYGAFSITPDDTAGASVAYDEVNNVYTLAACAAKAEYVIKGAKETNIVIEDVNGLGEGNYKGVKITLAGAAIVSTNSSAAISYNLDSKNVQISAKNKTTNKIYSLDEGDGIFSDNNIEVSGKGDLYVQTLQEHAFNADGTITLYGSNNIEIASGHDGIHCKKLLTTNDDLETFSGKVTIDYAVSQGIEGTTSKGSGLVSIDGGVWSINNCESVFKTDVSLTIGANATVTATGISYYAVVKGDEAEGLPVVTVDGTFTVDGLPYSA